LVDKRSGDQHGIYYEALVNTVRAQIPSNVHFVMAKAVSASTGALGQSVATSTDATVSARLIVLANGLNVGVRDSLNLERDIISRCHSITVGFNMKPKGGG